MTDAERRLWAALRNRRLADLKFRRQVPLGRYVLDFYCEDARLAVEVDGSQHAQRVAYDEARTLWLASKRIRTVRVWNNDVIQNLAGVLEIIDIESGENVDIAEFRNELMRHPGA